MKIVSQLARASLAKSPPRTTTRKRKRAGADQSKATVDYYVWPELTAVTTAPNRREKKMVFRVEHGSDGVVYVPRIDLYNFVYAASRSMSAISSLFRGYKLTSRRVGGKGQWQYTLVGLEELQRLCASL